MHTPTHPVPARDRAQLLVSDVSVMRGHTPVLSHIDLTVSPTSRIAIVGENGRGKSTLLQVLDGTIAPDAGTVQRIGTLAVAAQEMPAHDDRTVGDVVGEAIAPAIDALAALERAALGLTDADDGAADRYALALQHVEALGAWDAERRVDIALAALAAESDRGRRLADLSVGQRYRVRLACLLGASDDFLLVDEPTNHLDRSGLDFLTARLRTRAGGIVVVTHDRALLDDVAATIVDLDPTADGRPRISGDGYASYRQGRQAERERWQRDYDNQRIESARLQASLSDAQNRLVSGWRPEKGSAKHGRATRAGGLVQSVRRRQDQLEAHAVTVPEPPLQLRFPDLPTRNGAVLLDVDGVTFEGRLPHPVSFSLSHRSRLVVTGPNGAGKSTLLRIAAGDVQADAGAVRRPHGVRLGVLRQETALPLDRRVSDVFAAWTDRLIGAGTLGAGEAVGLSQLGLLRARESAKRVGELSMGQQRRLDLALVLAARPHVLLLDEPTNHLSIALVDDLTEALGATDAAVVLSTHDRQLLRDVAAWPMAALTATGVETRDEAAAVG